MYVRAYVCMHVCAYVCMYVHTYVHVCVWEGERRADGWITRQTDRFDRIVNMVKDYKVLPFKS
jgi:hypothetical protein